MSTFENLRARRAELMKVAQQYGAYNLRIFGSAARGEDHAQSDIDLLIDMETGRSLLDLAGLQLELSHLLGRKVDVLTERGLNPYLRSRILSEARTL